MNPVAKFSLSGALPQSASGEAETETDEVVRGESFSAPELAVPVNPFSTVAEELFSAAGVSGFVSARVEGAAEFFRSILTVMATDDSRSATRAVKNRARALARRTGNAEDRSVDDLIHEPYLTRIMSHALQVYLEDSD